MVVWSKKEEYSGRRWNKCDGAEGIEGIEGIVAWSARPSAVVVARKRWPC